MAWCAARADTNYDGKLNVDELARGARPRAANKHAVSRWNGSSEAAVPSDNKIIDPFTNTNIIFA
jgi:hypothetical protein